MTLGGTFGFTGSGLTEITIVQTKSGVKYYFNAKPQR